MSVKTQHQCADIFTKSLTREKFERFRDTIRGSVPYKEMVEQEIASSEQQAKAKENKSNAKANVESKTINLALVEDVIQQIETFIFDDENQYAVASNHYSMINLTGKVNPWQSFQECIEGKATYAIPGYP